MFYVLYITGMYVHVLLEFGVRGTLISAVMGSGRVALYHQLKSFLGVVMSWRESTAFHLLFNVVLFSSSSQNL